MTELVAISETERKILSIIRPSVKQMGFDIIRVKYSTKGAPTVQIMIEKNDGTIEIDDCARVSTTISTLLDINDPVEEGYNLEVSSPGINRPLTRKKDFEIWKGYNANIKTKEFIDQRKNFNGILLGEKNGEILLDINEGTIGLNFDWIEESHLSVSIEKILKNNKNKKTELINENIFDQIEIEKS